MRQRAPFQPAQHTATTQISIHRTSTRNVLNLEISTTLQRAVNCRETLAASFSADFKVLSSATIAERQNAFEHQSCGSSRKEKKSWTGAPFLNVPWYSMQRQPEPSGWILGRYRKGCRKAFVCEGRRKIWWCLIRECASRYDFVYHDNPDD